MTLQSIERLDEDPSYLVKDVYGRILAVSRERAMILACNETRKTNELLVLQGKDDVSFAHPDRPDVPLPATTDKRLTRGSAVFVLRSPRAVRSEVLSKDVQVAHAAKIDTGRQNLIEPVDFHTTQVPPKFWRAAGYTAVIRFQGKTFATIAPYPATSLGYTFGKRFQKGSYDVIDVERQEIQGFYPSTPKIRCRIVDGA